MYSKVTVRVLRSYRGEFRPEFHKIIVPGNDGLKCAHHALVVFDRSNLGSGDQVAVVQVEPAERHEWPAEPKPLAEPDTVEAPVNNEKNPGKNKKNGLRNQA